MKKIISMILCCTLFCCFTAPCSAFSEDSNAQSGTDEPINRPPLSTPESYVSSDGQFYYDAVHDAYYSNIVRVIDGIMTDISPSEYAVEVAAAAENAYSSASSVLNADIPSIEPLANTYFYKFNEKNVSRPWIDTSYTYVISGLVGQGTTATAEFSKSISTEFSIGLNAAKSSPIASVIPELGINAAWTANSQVSLSYSGTPTMAYGRMCYQPIRYTITGDIEKWNLYNNNRPPVFVEVENANVEVYCPATVNVGSQTFADGYYFLVQRSTPFYESDLNKSCMNGK